MRTKKPNSVANLKFRLFGFQVELGVLGQFFAIFAGAAFKSRRQIPLFFVNNSVVQTASPTTADYIFRKWVLSRLVRVVQAGVKNFDDRFRGN